jgi:hypothetical protein
MNILTVLNDTIKKANHDYEFKPILSSIIKNDETGKPTIYIQVTLRCYDYKRNNYYDVITIRLNSDDPTINIDNVYDVFYITLYKNIIFGKPTNDSVITTEGRPVFMFRDILELVLTDKELPI